MLDQQTPSAGAFLQLIHNGLLESAKIICGLTLGFHAHFPIPVLTWLMASVLSPCSAYDPQGGRIKPHFFALALPVA